MHLQGLPLVKYRTLPSPYGSTLSEPGLATEVEVCVCVCAISIEAIVTLVLLPNCCGRSGRLRG